MSPNPKRLPLLLDLGFLASRALTQEYLDHQVLPGETKPIPYALVYWDAVLDKLEDLARMDHEDNYTPASEPILEGAGVFNSYGVLRHWIKLLDAEDSNLT
ncbi:hypothetical protein [Pseudomonas viridiflava]|uniref:hypothetical protein n=1 Tax=Pseudomonas viridiflava TaxID=33069 RepID=UPI000F0437DD|nr:hypothetical protein [Pseudomonas viridiflava]